MLRSNDDRLQKILLVKAHFSITISDGSRLKTPSSCVIIFLKSHCFHTLYIYFRVLLFDQSTKKKKIPIESFYLFVCFFFVYIDSHSNFIIIFTADMQTNMTFNLFSNFFEKKKLIFETANGICISSNLDINFEISFSNRWTL